MPLPDATITGEQWAAYLGEQSLVPPPIAQAIGGHALALTDEIGEWRSNLLCDFMYFQDENNVAEDYASWDFKMTNVCAALADSRILSIRQRSLLQHLIPIVDFAEAMAASIGIEPFDFIINKLPPKGHIAQHRDCNQGIVCAVSLLGSGRMSFRDHVLRTRRFDTSPGNVVVIDNSATKEEHRPEHWVWAQAASRLSLTMYGIPLKK